MPRAVRPDTGEEAPLLADEEDALERGEVSPPPVRVLVFGLPTERRDESHPVERGCLGPCSMSPAHTPEAPQVTLGDPLGAVQWSHDDDEPPPAYGAPMWSHPRPVGAQAEAIVLPEGQGRCVWCAHLNCEWEEVKWRGKTALLTQEHAGCVDSGRAAT